MVPLPTWPNPNEYDGSLLKSNPYLTAKEGTRKEEAGDCPPIDESKRLRQEGLLTFNQIVCLFNLLSLQLSWYCGDRREFYLVTLLPLG